MKSYTVLKRSPQIDWSEVPVMQLELCDWTGPYDIGASVQICYDDKALYVRLAAFEDEVIARENDILGMPCFDSCLEFFFSPITGDKRYINIEYNLNCCMYLGIGSANNDHIRLLPENRDVFNPSASRTKDGWEITYQVPFTFIRTLFPIFEAKSGGRISANFYKCGYNEKEGHFLSWNRVECDHPDFHRPEYFGKLILE